jgi:signal transduction histidine kinase
MLTATLILALGVACVLGFRIRQVRLEVLRMTAAVKARRAVLIERRDGFAGSSGLVALQDELNQLVAENVERSRTERSYLDQIQVTLGNLREAVLIIDADHHIVLANNALSEILKTPHSPLGKRLESVIQGSDFFEFVRQVKSGGFSDFFVLEVRINRETHWFEVTGSTLPKQEGFNGPLTLFVLHDITKQKRLELIRKEFVANVSHELRTPVTIIKGFTETLIEDHHELSVEERAHFLNRIQKNVERLHQMLEELLILSRLESNPDTIQRERHSLTKVVSEAVDNFSMRLDPKEHILATEFTEQPDVVLLDPIRFSQVINNLLENVLRHAKGFRHLTIRTKVEAPEVICEVSDDGAGIPAKDLPHIFERFYRVDKGRSRESGGTGLGLSIVKHIVQQHGGTIDATSKPGEGTTIRVRIPFPETLAQRTVLSSLHDQMRTGQAKA